MSTVITGDQTGTVGVINTKTSVASTSGTSIDFTGIPAGVKRITVMFSGVSTSGTSNYQVQIGSGSFETSGYLCSGAQLGASTLATSNITSGIALIPSGSASSVVSGTIVISQLTTNSWVSSGTIAFSNGTYIVVTAGARGTTTTLDRVRITTINGTDTFDAGSINILYE